jgi:trigger factor
MEAVFAVKVTGLKAEVLPELDDDFASKIEPGKTLEDIKGLIATDIESRMKQQIEEIKINAVLAKLNEAVDFEVPADFLASETQGQADAMVREEMQKGASQDDLAANQEAVFEAAGVRAKNSLKTNFLLTEIAKQEKLSVANSDVLARVTVMAKQAKKPVKGFMKELQRDGRLGNIRQNMLFGKAIDFLIEHATIKEVDSPAEESQTEQ